VSFRRVGDSSGAAFLSEIVEILDVKSAGSHLLGHFADALTIKPIIVQPGAVVQAFEVSGCKAPGCGLR
jgi:hypothetical protein